ncbi:MAG TPA: ABC transporter permease [Puia sp.]
MLQNYFRTGLRYLQKNKSHSFINIAGLSVGMAVALLIGLWIWDELSFDKNFRSYDHVAQVMQRMTIHGGIATGKTIPVPLGTELRKNYGNDFKYVAIASHTDQHILTSGDKVVTYPGAFMSEQAPQIFTLPLLEGSPDALKDPSSMLISQTVAKALFGDADPMGKLIKLDNDASLRVAGIYEDLPLNSTLRYLSFIAPWDLYATHALAQRTLTDWNDNSWFLYVQLADNADMAGVSEKIKNVKLGKVSRDDAKKFAPTLFLQPMSKWHLYAQFKNGINTGGDIEYVWLFGTIGTFVLLLACINFMNLSTARSEKRAKEVGIRKAVGSVRSQLITQFFCESLLVALLAFAFSLLLVQLTLPFFNGIAGKKVMIPWNNLLFWATALAFTFFTGLIAGSYPALYLSSFKPVKVLKGVFKAGRLAAIPRQALVVVQFTVSIVLIIATIVVFKQIQYAKDRPVGYTRAGLISINTSGGSLEKHFDAVRADLLRSGYATEAAESSSPATGVNNNRSDVTWEGKEPDLTTDFANIRITMGYGRTVGWQFVQGRDFDSKLLTDSSSVVINEAAARYIGFKDPVGQVLRFRNRDHRVIGVIRDMVMTSPYDPAKQTIFYITPDEFGYLNIKINAEVSAHDAIRKIEAVCKTYSPAVPFSYKFVDDEYAAKFFNDVRIGRLAGFFASLAVFISCLGLFGMASFMAEQRLKEIGVRKVLGASVLNLWGLLSRDFVRLVAIAILLALPLARSFMKGWLEKYQYRAEMSWWIFALTAVGAVLITLLTVSYQSVRAATTNPVKSLRTE